MMKLMVLNFCLILCLASCAKKAGESESRRVVQPQIGETTGETDGGSTGGSDGGTTAGGTVGGSTGGSDGGTASGGTEGGSTGGSNPVALYIGNSLDAQSGIETTGFSDAVDLSSATEIDFNQFKPGKYTKLGNFAENKFEFTVGAERLKGQEAVDTLENAFGTKTYKFKVEKPVSQNGIKGIESGIQTKSGLFAIKKITGIWKFAKPVSYWGANFIDVESSSKIPAKLRLFDCDSKLIEEILVAYPENENGNKQIHFVGFVSDKANVCAVSVTVGDYSLIGGITKGLFRAIAIDDFVFGE